MIAYQDKHQGRGKRRGEHRNNLLQESIVSLKSDQKQNSFCKICQNNYEAYQEEDKHQDNRMGSFCRKKEIS